MSKKPTTTRKKEPPGVKRARLARAKAMPRLDQTQRYSIVEAAAYLRLSTRTLESEDRGRQK